MPVNTFHCQCCLKTHFSSYPWETSLIIKIRAKGWKYFPKYSFKCSKLWDCHLLTGHSTNNLRNCFPPVPCRLTASLLSFRLQCLPFFYFPRSSLPSDVDTHTHRWPLASCWEEIWQGVSQHLHCAKDCPEHLLWLPVSSFAFICSSFPLTAYNISFWYSQIYLHPGISPSNPLAVNTRVHSLSKFSKAWRKDFLLPGVWSECSLLRCTRSFGSNCSRSPSEAPGFLEALIHPIRAWANQWVRWEGSHSLKQHTHSQGKKEF